MTPSSSAASEPADIPDRETLQTTIESLVASQFATLVFQLQLKAAIPGVTATPTERSIAVVECMESREDGLSILHSRLNSISQSRVGSTSQFDQKQVGQNEVYSLIATIRQTADSGIVLQLATIASAITRGTIVSDERHSREDPLAAIAFEVAAMNGQDPKQPKILDFAVAFHQLLPAGSPGQISLRQWFDKYQADHFDFDVILGRFWDVPDQSQRSVWLEVSWRSTVASERQYAVAHLRYGNRSHPVSDRISKTQPRSELKAAIAQYKESGAAHYGGINHLSVVRPFDDLNDAWELDPDCPRSESFMPYPVALRTTGNGVVRKTPEHLQDDDLNLPGDKSRYAEHVLARGVFATGKLNGSGRCPCETIKLVLNSASLCIWTRCNPETDEDESALKAFLRGKRPADVPRELDRQRRGSSRSSFWQQTVLYFHPNVADIPAEDDSSDSDSIFQFNTQLSAQLN